MVDDPQSGKTLDATQLRVAVALEQRLEKDLQMCENVYDSSKGTSDSSALDRDDSLEKPGVLLFWPGRVKRKNSAGANLPVTKRYIKANSVSSDDGDAMEDLLSVVVEPTDLLKQAERVALQARLNVAPVNPTSDDEGGKAKRRKRKREKEELALQMKWQETGGELTNKNYS